MLPVTTSFEHLSYGSTAVINILILSVLGLSLDVPALKGLIFTCGGVKRIQK